MPERSAQSVRADADAAATQDANDAAANADAAATDARNAADEADDAATKATNAASNANAAAERHLQILGEFTSPYGGTRLQLGIGTGLEPSEGPEVEFQGEKFPAQITFTFPA